MFNYLFIVVSLLASGPSIFAATEMSSGSLVRQLVHYAGDVLIPKENPNGWRRFENQIPVAEVHLEMPNGDRTGLFDSACRGEIQFLVGSQNLIYRTFFSIADHIEARPLILEISNDSDVFGNILDLQRASYKDVAYESLILKELIWGYIGDTDIWPTECDHNIWFFDREILQASDFSLPEHGFSSQFGLCHHIASIGSHLPGFVQSGSDIIERPYRNPYRRGADQDHQQGPKGHLLLSIQILFGACCFIGGCYLFDDAFRHSARRPINAGVLRAIGGAYGILIGLVLAALALAA